MARGYRLCWKLRSGGASRSDRLIDDLDTALALRDEMARDNAEFAVWIEPADWPEGQAADG